MKLDNNNSTLFTFRRSTCSQRTIATSSSSRGRDCIWRYVEPQTRVEVGQWLWLSWSSVRFQFQSPRFESSHRLILYWTFSVNCVEKTKRKKEALNAPFIKYKEDSGFFTVSIGSSWLRPHSKRICLNSCSFDSQKSLFCDILLTSSLKAAENCDNKVASQAAEM